jgi:FKBP-type peptidyl-prolyl cis-trans isomerase
VKKFLVSLTVALAAVGCNSDGGGGSPTDPSQVNIEFSFSDLTVGTGPQAAVGNSVTVNYTGWLYNPAGSASKGTEFDSSLRPGRTPYPLVVGARQVIPGFEQGIVGMQVGGKRRIYVPPNMAYGNSGSQDGSIPPGASIVFEIELMTVQ